MPVSLENQLWRRNPWWIETPQFEREHGRPPESLGEYVDWGQARHPARASAAGWCNRRPVL